MNFYVYEHWRPDTDLPFYVGKGRGGRAWSVRPRNPHYGNVVRKLAAVGLCVEVRLVRGGMLATDAYALEIERIAFWRAAGVNLVNMTGGGEGMLNPSDELRGRLSVISKNRVRTPEWRARIAEAARNLSKESRAKRSKSLTGIVRSAETRAKVSIAKRGTICITNGATNRMVRADGEIPNGWHRGRTKLTQVVAYVPEGELV